MDFFPDKTEKRTIYVVRPLFLSVLWALDRGKGASGLENVEGGGHRGDVGDSK